jgi:hypothetical protein
MHSWKLKGRDHLGYLGVDERTILKWILKTYSVDWVHLAQDKDQWRAVVKTVMHHRVSQKVRNFLTSFSRRTFFQGRSLIVKFTCVWSRTLFSRLICGSE